LLVIRSIGSALDRQQAELLQGWQGEYRRQPFAVALFVGASSGDQGLARFTRDGEARIASNLAPTGLAGRVQASAARRRAFRRSELARDQALALSSRGAVKHGSPASWLLQDWQGEYRRHPLAVALFVGASSGDQGLARFTRGGEARFASKLAPTGLAGRGHASPARRRAFRRSEPARDPALAQFTRDGEAQIASKLAPTKSIMDLHGQ